jgi:uncharacterized protein YdeI (YjbR/CyaY-like superfamily)
MKKPEEHLEVRTRAEWRQWLLDHHQRDHGVWLVTFKKNSGQPYLSNDDIVEEALCFGWIDSKPGKVDEQRTKLWFAPRQVGTGWSRVNKDRIKRLISTGLMHESGLRKIAAAQSDGSWSKLDGVEALEIPADLAAAFRHHPGSATFFDTFPRSAKRGILEWILQAKKPETRARRLEETARLAAENQRANQWRG